MSWTTLYISGKPGFQNEVLKQMEHSSISFLPGSSDGNVDLLLFWIDETQDIRKLKLAIGSKIIFKYRLTFFNTIEQQQPATEQELTPKEEALIRKMNAWEADRFRHSA